MKKDIVILIINWVWFGVWMYIIFGLGNSGWWILVPIFAHWRKESPLDNLLHRASRGEKLTKQEMEIIGLETVRRLADKI